MYFSVVFKLKLALDMNDCTSSIDAQLSVLVVETYDPQGWNFIAI